MATMLIVPVAPVTARIFKNGPIAVGRYDPNHLDADHDGIGCELSDRTQGA